MIPRCGVCGDNLTTSMPTYGDKLRDPRWQKRRLDIFERDKWTCRVCADGKRNQQIHHSAYIPGIDPWDYPDHMLFDLCEKCHDKEGSGKLAADLELVDTLRLAGALNGDILRFAMMIRDCKRAHPGSALSQINFALDEVWTRMVQKKAIHP